ncbi:MAG: HlyD family efflux transporter periplasmic adaptor subunit [Thermoanaerobaculia bacterium]|nr:HlyD family efflux transporter periplasmic adaptor subunit [Thermoanaerobaculia bacterium]
MDIPRTPPNRTRRRLIVAGGGIAALVLVSVGLARLEPAAPEVERATLYIDAVTRGPFVREVRGNGSLVPEDIRWIPAITEGRVERIVILPGAVVEPDTVLLELTNPELEGRTREAELALVAAEADLAALRVQLDNLLLDQQAQSAAVRANFLQSELEAESRDELAKEGLISHIEAKIARLRLEEATTRQQLEERRLASAEAANAARLAAQEARVAQLREVAGLRQREVDALRVRAGFAGVLQVIAVQPGQQVLPGSNLARVADPTRLKAELRVPETQARDVAIGLPAKVDTRNGVVAGRVIRVDPAVTNGTVLVDVALEGELPRGARPDLSVDGTIVIDEVDDALTVGRPAFGQPDSRVSLFKLNPDGGSAVRVPVRLGRGSVHRIEVLEGLSEGDRVILSDMSTWDAVDRVRLE